MSGLKFSNRGLPDVTRLELNAVIKRLDAARAEAAYLRTLCATVIDAHDRVVMDTEDDRDLHDRAIDEFRNALAVAHLAGTS